MNIKDYIEGISDEKNKERFEEVIDWVRNTFPNLDLVVKWNQPIFLDHNTYIISITSNKNHISVILEKPIMDEFKDEIRNSGYVPSKMIFKILKKDMIDYTLMKNIISKTINLKVNHHRFWL